MRVLGFCLFLALGILGVQGFRVFVFLSLLASGFEDFRIRVCYDFRAFEMFGVLVLGF